MFPFTSRSPLQDPPPDGGSSEPSQRHQRFVPLPRLRWIILLLLFLSTTINYIDRQALSVLLPTLRSELNLTSSDYGMITTIFLVAYTISQLFSGLLVDKIGTRKGFAISITVWSAAAIAHAASLGVTSLAIFRFMLGLGEAGNWPAGGKAISQWFPQNRRAFAMGLFDGGSALGAVIAPPLVALLAIHFTWRSAFVAVGLLGFAWLAAWFWIFDDPERHRWLSASDKKQAKQDADSDTTASSSISVTFFSLIRMRQLWGLLATRIVATPVWWFYVFWLPDYLSKCRGFSLVEIGLFAWMPYVTVDLGKLLGGALSDSILKKGWSVSVARKGVMSAGAVCMAAGVLVSGALTSIGAIFWVCIATFGFGLWSANILALHADVFSSDKMGSALGITGMGASLSGALSTFFIGRVVDSYGYQPVFLVAGLCSFVACIALYFWVGKIKPRSPDNAESKAL